MPSALGRMDGRTGAAASARATTMSAAAWSRRPHRRITPRGPRAVSASRANAAAPPSNSPERAVWSDSSTRTPARTYSRTWWTPKGNGRRRDGRRSACSSPVAMGALPRGRGGTVTVLGGRLVCFGRRGVGALALAPLGQALLELALRRAERPGQLGQLAAAEDEHHHHQDDDDSPLAFDEAEHVHLSSVPPAQVTLRKQG